MITWFSREKTEVLNSGVVILSRCILLQDIPGTSLSRGMRFDTVEWNAIRGEVVLYQFSGDDDGVLVKIETSLKKGRVS